MCSKMSRNNDRSINREKQSKIEAVLKVKKVGVDLRNKRNIILESTRNTIRNPPTHKLGRWGRSSA